ncbi:MAG: hypothetical protein U0527_13790 [Candidatus Eisenbacteria bacterium]
MSARLVRVFAMVHRTFVALGAVALLAGAGQAQSLWNAEGLGGWNEGYDLASRGTGYTAIGRVDPFGMSSLNPAALAWARRPAAHFGLLLENSWVKTDSDGSGGRTGTTRLPAVLVALPLSRGVGINLGFRDLTTGFYRYKATIHEGSGDAFERSLEGTGGLGQFQCGVTARALESRLALGAQLGVVGGTLRDLIRDDFEDDAYQDTRNLLRTRAEGGRPVTFGFQAQPIEALECGGFVTASTRLDVRSLFDNRTAQKEESRGHLDLPPGLGLGVTAHASARWRLSFDWSQRRWSEHDFALAGQEVGRGFTRLGDASRIGFGITRVPGEHPPKDPLASRSVYRAGFTRAILPVRQADGAEVAEWALTAGVGLPIQFDRGYVDGLFEFGKRGSASKTDLSETFLRLGMSVTFARLAEAF